jgi:PKD repeat protein
MKKSILLQLLTVLLFFSSACRKEQYLAPNISGVGDDKIILNIGDKMVLAPSITNLKGNSYTWLINGKESASDQIHYTFEATQPGDFEVTFKVINKGGTDQQSFKIFVEDPIQISIADHLQVSMSNVLEITPVITGPDRDDYQYEWLIEDSVIGKKLNHSFISPLPGTYKLTLRATAGKQTATASRMITVKEEQYVKNAYTLLEYAPSPATNHNWSIIGYAESWKYGGEYALPYNDFLVKAAEVRKEDFTAALVIGSWGGSATFKFDHTVANVPGKTDIELSATYSNRDLPAVFVAYDRNKNGIADEDEWYEIKNGDFGLEDMPEYEMTFTHIKTETDDRRIYTHFTWKDNQEEPAQGEVNINKTFTSAQTTAGVISTRGLFPGINMIDFSTKEIALLQGWSNSFSRKGKRITRNLSGAPAFSQKLNIDIGLAVNEKGESIQLPGIDFIKIQKVIYPFHQDLSTGGILTDYNMDEKRMLHVSSIIDKHLPN